MAKENSEAVKAARQAPPATPRTGLFDGLVGIAGNALLKSGLSFATQIATKAVMHALSGDQATHSAPEEREIPRHDYV
jgi:hypothetical protein